MSIKKGEALEIRQVGNGFLVRPAPNYGRDVAILDESMMVFEEIKNLEEFMERHFARPE